MLEKCEVKETKDNGTKILEDSLSKLTQKMDKLSY